MEIAKVSGTFGELLHLLPGQQFLVSTEPVFILELLFVSVVFTSEKGFYANVTS